MKSPILINNPFKRGSKIYSILGLKCPRCHRGNLFVSKNPYNPKMFDKMPAKCPVCCEDFEREPGFYWGAMMVSHATTTLIAVIIHLSFFYFYGWDVIPSIIANLIALLLLIPIIFRNSRAAWINFFVHFEGESKKNETKANYH